MTSEEFNVHKELKLARMAEITAEQKKLKDEYSELEAFFLKKGITELEDTKLKSVTYQGSAAHLMVTVAQSLKLETPTSLKSVLGKSYDDAVTEKLVYTVTAPFTRMLIGIKTGDFMKTTIKDLVSELGCDDKAKTALIKKLKGAEPKTDKKSLVSIGGLSEEDAEATAYFIAEAAVWEQFQRLLKVNDITDDNSVNRLIDKIRGAVVVEETPRVTFTLNE